MSEIENKGYLSFENAEVNRNIHNSGKGKHDYKILSTENSSNVSYSFK